MLLLLSPSSPSDFDLEREVRCLDLKRNLLRWAVEYSCSIFCQKVCIVSWPRGWWQGGSIPKVACLRMTSNP